MILTDEQKEFLLDLNIWLRVNKFIEVPKRWDRQNHDAFYRAVAEELGDKIFRTWKVERLHNLENWPPSAR